MRASLAVIAAATYLAGCGQSSVTSQVKPPAAVVGQSSMPSGTVVRLVAGEIVPAHLTTLVGHAVHWQNIDTFAHRLVAVSGAHFRSGRLGQGAVFTWVPRRPGTVRYRDDLHPRMTGTITVIT